MLIWISLALIVGGASSELLGVASIAEDVTGRGPSSVIRWLRSRKSATTRAWWRGLAKVGFHRKQSVVIHGATATAFISGAETARVKITRDPQRTVEQKIADLEDDVSRLDERLYDVAEAHQALEKQVELAPASALRAPKKPPTSASRPGIPGGFPIQMRSLRFLFVGILLAASGSALTLGCDDAARHRRMYAKKLDYVE